MAVGVEMWMELDVEIVFRVGDAGEDRGREEGEEEELGDWGVGEARA